MIMGRYVGEGEKLLLSSAKTRYKGDENRVSVEVNDANNDAIERI
jgi:hypothetical protein